MCKRPEAVLSRLLAQETERSPVWQCILLEGESGLMARREFAFRGLFTRVWILYKCVVKQFTLAKIPHWLLCGNRL